MAVLAFLVAVQGLDVLVALEGQGGWRLGPADGVAAGLGRLDQCLQQAQGPGSGRGVHVEVLGELFGRAQQRMDIRDGVRDGQRIGSGRGRSSRVLEPDAHVSAVTPGVAQPLARRQQTLAAPRRSHVATRLAGQRPDRRSRLVDQLRATARPDVPW